MDLSKTVHSCLPDTWKKEQGRETVLQLKTVALIKESIIVSWP
jgi:hypothetical protein